MPVTLAQITFDAVDAPALAGFWSALLERPIDPDPTEFYATIGMSERATGLPAFMFLKNTDAPGTKNRMHLDLGATDRAATVRRAMELGATKVADLDEYGIVWTTLRDPEGNYFDIADENAPH